MKFIYLIIKALDNSTLFIIISLCLILNNYLINEFIYSDYFLYEGIGDQLSADRAANLVYMLKKWKWIGYMLIPIILLVKIYLISFCIEIGAIFKAYRISIKRIFRVVLFAEIVFLSAQLIRTASLYFSDYDTLNEINFFYPLSILGLLNPENLSGWLLYPLQMVNLFVLVYFLLLAYGLSLMLGKKYLRMLSFAFCTYGPCLLIWLLFVMFINVSLL